MGMGGETRGRGDAGRWRSITVDFTSNIRIGFRIGGQGGKIIPIISNAPLPAVEGL